MVAAADPVLDLANPAAMGFEPCAGQQAFVDAEDVVDGKAGTREATASARSSSRAIASEFATVRASRFNREIASSASATSAAVRTSSVMFREPSGSGT